MQNPSKILYIFLLFFSLFLMAPRSPSCPVCGKLYQLSSRKSQFFTLYAQKGKSVRIELVSVKGKLQIVKPILDSKKASVVCKETSCLISFRDTFPFRLEVKALTQSLFKLKSEIVRP